MTPAQLDHAHAITLKNPWAHLVARYGKNVENRTWMPHADVNWLLIHAGKSWDRDADLIGFGYIGDPHTSAIVAVADLAFACNTSRNSDTIICGCGEWAMPGQCHWRLGNIRTLSDPVPCGGRQGLWRPPQSVVALVARQLSFQPSQGEPA